jgi:glutamate-1-semialdehyde 2,1-aminomutase
MESWLVLFTLYALGVAGLIASLAKLKTRLELSKAKHWSLSGHARMARRIASLIPLYEYDETHFFRSDAPPDEIAARRRAGFLRLSKLYHDRFPETLRLTAKVKDGISDLQFTEAYRVPFQFNGFVRQHLPVGAFVQSSCGVTVTDLDGNRFYDLTGSYGVNLLGYDIYKECIERGAQHVRELGPVLGAYHPVIATNVKRLKEISGLDEVSFHMSGTEAVMQAARLARYHTRRSHLVRFCGAYHGWWGDVQPGIGNPVPARDTYTLKDMSDDSLRVLRNRDDIACVLINPLQALHPNAGAPSDSSLADSSRSSRFNQEAYTAWLKRLRTVCTERKFVLIFDEAFVGFRLAPGGAQEYFGIQADISHLREDSRGRPSGRRGLRPQRADETLPRRSPSGHLLCPRHIQLPPLRDGRDARVPGAHRQPGNPRVVPQSRHGVERSSRPAQPAAARRERAGGGGEHVLHLDCRLHAAIALQLDASILSARRRFGVELDRNGAHYLQFELHRRRLRSGHE